MSKAKTLDWLDIKSEVHRRGLTLTELAIRNGLEPSVCRKVKQVTNYKAQTVIAAFIGHNPEDLWPNRYPQGKPYIVDSKKYPPLESQKSAVSVNKEKAA